MHTSLLDTVVQIYLCYFQPQVNKHFKAPYQSEIPACTDPLSTQFRQKLNIMYAVWEDMKTAFNLDDD